MTTSTPPAKGGQALGRPEPVIPPVNAREGTRRHGFATPGKGLVKSPLPGIAHSFCYSSMVVLE